LAPRLPNPEDYDLFFVHPNFEKNFPDSDKKNFRMLPLITFTGFHPDCMYLSIERKFVASPVGDYHSSLVAACFLLQVSPADVSDWLDGDRPAQIGFLAEFDRSKTFLLKVAGSIDFDLEPLLADWMRFGTAFMYSINHPAIHVCRDIARLALIKEGFDALNEETIPPDGLARAGSWPVYPVVARRLAIAAQPFFTYSVARATKEGKEGLAFDEFVALSYRLYQDLPAEALAQSPQVARILKALGKN
jgi:hypothetical protein